MPKTHQFTRIENDTRVDVVIDKIVTFEVNEVNDGEGAIIHLSDGSSIAVAESLDEVRRVVNQQ
ncbi:hypothetical protein [Hyphomonas jannaschiana]|uniref:Uncharacterized protein n=1 Tax=Hyphomonas jannaschiana VP2 TaxID=1280952 RepID=A0A059FG23_9PROT|nr:hypothetical protein [Hyphomonas jannaschiana]KCZ89537.1 hypothetical protein HJA_04777 [Hyphomonas jannaschiana VP2]